MDYRTYIKDFRPMQPEPREPECQCCGCRISKEEAEDYNGYCFKCDEKGYSKGSEDEDR